MVLPFDEGCRKRYFSLLNEVFDSNQWSEGKMQRIFEEKFGELVKLSARAMSNGGAGLLAILEYLDVKGKDVVLPANTFWATAQAVKKAGGNPIYADCNKEDLCLSCESVKEKITSNTKVVIVVHIGGHIAFQIEAIKKLCEDKGIFLVEDCAHAHGAEWNKKKAGSWGIAGSYSFYATKTMPTGEGGMVVSKDLNLIDFVEKYRNYGKKVIDGKVTYQITTGFNYRINEMTSALGIVQIERLDDILAWKRQLAEKYDEIFDNRVIFPEGMVSGYYKYIVFDYPLKEQTGQVFGINDLGYRIDNKKFTLENSEWVVEHHKCAPIYYGWDKGMLTSEQLRRHLLGN